MHDQLRLFTNESSLNEVIRLYDEWAEQYD